MKSRILFRIPSCRCLSAIPTSFDGRLEIRVRDDDNENGGSDAAPLIPGMPTQTLSWQIIAPASGGAADGDQFTIESITNVTVTPNGITPTVFAPTGNQFGLLTFKQSFDGDDADDPLDSNGDGIFEVTIRVSDGNGGQTDQTFQIAIIKQDDNSPIFTSLANRTSAENTTTTSMPISPPH